MKNVFKVKVKIGKAKPLELLFDDQDRAERFINATTQILTDNGKKEVKFVPSIVSIIDCDDDIIEAFTCVTGKSPDRTIKTK